MSESAVHESASVESLVSRVADEFVQRLEQGEQPQIEEFTGRHPEIADVLRQVLPALELLRSPCAKTISAEGLSSTSPALGFLGDYRLCREVGRGGMGVVYEAEQISLGRRVALKVLPLAAALDAKQLQRFKLEAQAAAHLHHTNIVPVFSVGCERGVHYYAMQYIEGRSLADVIGAMRETEVSKLVAPNLHRDDTNSATIGTVPEKTRSSTEAAALSTKYSIRSPIFIGTAARLGAQAAEALEYAHQMGVVHRDIKPGNLLADARGNVLITDFGLARYRNDAALTMTGDMLGTLRYMSPEQALAKPVALDHRTDIYSLGATLYELLTLEPAIDGREREEVLRRIAWEDPKPLRQINPAVPIELETIVLKAIAKSPTDRYATAQELADDLARFLQDEPIRARRPTLLQRTKRWARRHQPIVWSAAVSMTLLIVAALVGLTISNFLISQERERTLRQNHKAQQAESQAKRRLFDARLAQARASRFSRQVGQRFESWRVLTEAAQLAGELNLDEKHWLELRDEAIACLALTDLRLVQQWKGFPPGSSRGIAFDGGVERYARSDLLGNISVRRMMDDQELIRLPGSAGKEVNSGISDVNLGASEICFSPHGNLLAVRYWRQSPQEPPNFRLWDIANRTAIYEPPFWVAGFNFSPDSRYLALGQNNGYVIREVASKKEVMRQKLNWPVEILAFHPSGAQLAIAHFQRTEVEVREVGSGAVKSTIHGPTGVSNLAWHPDGVLLAAGGTDHKIYLWNTATGQQHAVLQGHQNTVVSMCFAPGGDLLLSYAWDGTSRLWDPWTGRELLSFPGIGYCFSEDGRWLASRAGGNVSLWELGFGREYRTLRRSPERTREGFQIGDISLDGRWLVTASREGVGLWDMKTGKESRLLASCAIDVKFHPNGEELFVSGESGIYRWSIERNETVPRLGKSVKLPVPGLTHRIALHPAGRLLTVINYGGAQIMDLEQPADHGKHLEHMNAASLATSPDGKWTATGVFNGFGVKIWDANSGRSEIERIHDESSTMVAFSPDSRYLVTGTATEFSFWDVGTWKLVHQISREQGVESPGEMVFSPDGALLAIALSPCVTQLIEPATGRALAKLHAPDTDQVFILGFTPDSRQLIVSTAAGSIRVWDLQRIRTQLQELGLDWDLATK